MFKNLIKWFMLLDCVDKVIIILASILFFILMTTSLNAKSSDVLIYQNKKIIGSFTLEEFNNLVNNAEYKTNEMDAEQNERVKVELVDTPYKVQAENIYKAKFKIVWFNEQNVNIKEIALESKITINENANQPYPEWRVTYRNVTEYSTPILILLCVIFAIL